MIAEIRKTLLERKRQHDSSANITCNYSSFIPPARMAQLIAETVEKLDMTTVTNVDTITVLFQHDTTFHTTKAIAPLSGRVTVKVMKREAGKTKALISTPARLYLSPSSFVRSHITKPENGFLPKGPLIQTNPAAL